MLRLLPVLALVLLAPAGVQAIESSVVDEREAKAAFLFNVAKFVRWPGEAQGPLVIGVAGDPALAEVVERLLHGRRIAQRDVHMRRLDYTDDPSGSHVLFVAGAQPRRAAEMLQRMREGGMKPILTVGDTPQFLGDGGMVRFYLEGQRVRFRIDQKTAEAAGLKVSSQLLSLAAR